MQRVSPKAQGLAKRKGLVKRKGSREKKKVSRKAEGLTRLARKTKGLTRNGKGFTKSKKSWEKKKTLAKSTRSHKKQRVSRKAESLTKTQGLTRSKGSRQKHRVSRKEKGSREKAEGLTKKQWVSRKAEGLAKSRRVSRKAKGFTKSRRSHEKQTLRLQCQVYMPTFGNVGLKSIHCLSETPRSQKMLTFILSSETLLFSETSSIVPKSSGPPHAGSMLSMLIDFESKVLERQPLSHAWGDAFAISARNEATPLALEAADALVDTAPSGCQWHLHQHMYERNACCIAPGFGGNSTPETPWLS